MKLTERQINLLRVLYRSDDWLSASDIAERLQVSERTVQAELSALKDGLNTDDYSIASVRGKGNKLVLQTKSQSMDHLFQQENDDQMPIQISEQIMLSLIRPTPSDLDVLSDQLFISRSTMERNLTIIRKYLKDNDFELCLQKNRNTAAIVGSERWIRKLINTVLSNNSREAGRYMSELWGELDANAFQFVKRTVEETLYEAQISLTLEGTRDIVQQIAIAVLRMRQGCIRNSGDSKWICEDPKIRAVSAAILDKIGSRYGLQIQAPEQEYISSRIFYHYSHFHVKPVNVVDRSDSNGLETLAREILRKTQDAFQLDLMGDERIINGLTVHVVNILSNPANMNGSVRINPLLDVVKEQYPIAFELAVCIAQEMMNNSSRMLSENDISYIALYFVAALERKTSQETESDIKLSFVCDTGYANSIYLLFKLESLFGNTVKVIGPFSPLDEAASYLDADIVVSTVPIENAGDMPVVLISRLMAPIDTKLIQAAILNLQENRHSMRLEKLFRAEYFICTPCKSYLDIVSDMCCALEKNGAVQKGFRDSVMERELLSTTVMPNTIAIPHALKPLANETLISTAILKEPVQYGDKRVRVVFLLATREGEQKYLNNFYNYIIGSLRDPKRVNELAAITDYPNLIRLVKQNIKQNK